ncbi:MAG TPA: pseudouridine synthase [Polyangiales bacterium]|nr:pseudouridine synthase [Polyangiales bacterium]
MSSDLCSRGARPPASTPLVTAAPGPLAVLYQDDVLIVVNKPSGLSAHRGLANEGGDYVLTRVRDMLQQQVYLVHRLDRATSGAICLVRAPSHVEPMQRAFQDAQVDKRYLALTRGKIPAEITVDYAIPRSQERPKERVHARTSFRSLAVFEDRYALVEASPETGRYHQIRRHLSHLRCPIIGDTNYGDRKENRLFRERFGLFRLVLHAWRFSFPHPVHGERIDIRAPLLPDLALPLAAMGFPVDPKSGELEV